MAPRLATLSLAVLLGACCCCYAVPLSAKNLFLAETSKPHQPWRRDAREVVFAEASVAELIRYEPPAAYGDPGNANDYVDKFVVKLSTFLVENGYDPLRLDTPESDVKWMTAGGLSSVFRSGDATLHQAGTAIVIEANLGFHNIKAAAYIERKLWWVFWLMGTVHVEAKEVRLYGRLRADLGSGQLKLEELNITDWGSTSATMEGNNWIGTIASWFPSLVTSQVKQQLPPLLKDAVTKLVSTIDLGAITARHHVQKDH